MKISVKELNQIMAQQADLKQRLESEVQRNRQQGVVIRNQGMVIQRQEEVIIELQQYKVEPTKDHDNDCHSCPGGC